jgi:heat shock protein HtpX
MNAMKTTLLLGALTGLMVAVGLALGGRSGAVLAFVLAAAMNLGAYWFSDRLVLARYRASEVDAGQAPELHRMVEGLCARAGLPKPRIFLIPQDSPNAFATGRNPSHAAVAVTAGLVRMMDREELEGVLAHELSHVRHRDILIGSIAATLAGAVSLLAAMARWGALLGGYGGRDRDGGGGALTLLVTAIVAPIAALIIQMAVSRSREYAADRGAAEMTGNPHGLARALHKLGVASGRIPMEATPATSHLFIVSPLRGQSLASLFSTHPPLEERIRRLIGRETV